MNLNWFSLQILSIFRNSRALFVWQYTGVTGKSLSEYTNISIVTENSLAHY